VTTTAANIIAALARNDLDDARRQLTRALTDHPGDTGTLLIALAATVAVPPGTVVWGHGVDVWANPCRGDFAWRCGDCPWTGSGYRTAPVARSAAKRHADEHGIPLQRIGPDQ
jgi:hypothetical protein